MPTKTQLQLDDPDIFGNDAAEMEDPEVLASYFVEKSLFRPFYSPARRLAIIRARKGVGKSALLCKIGHDIAASERDALLLPIHGSDLLALANLQTTDPLTLINRWQEAICKLICLEIGKRLRFANSDTSTLMVEAAELAGLKGRNIIGALLDRLKTPMGPLSLEKPVTPQARNLLQAYSAGKDHLNVWLLVDDIDSTFINNIKFRLRISTFFSAVRKMIVDFRGINFRVSVRTDVWTAVVRADEAMDKCEQFVADLLWSSAETKRILAKKILSCIQRIEPESPIAKEWSATKNAPELLRIVFAPTFDWAGEHLPPERLMHLLSAGRPRWSAQLGRLAGREAAARQADRITLAHIDEVLPRFGKLRLDDLHREHSHQYPGLDGLTTAFAGGKSIYYTPDLLEIIWDKYIVRMGGLDELPRLEGFKVTKPLDLAHFLFKIGFISARIRNSDDSLTFVKYDEQPDLLTTVVNPDMGVRWDVHPSYRKQLRIYRGSV